MADQSVNITNLPDSGSHQRVAYDLYRDLVIFSEGVENEKFSDLVARRLNLYAQCLTATYRGRIETNGLK